MEDEADAEKQIKESKVDVDVEQGFNVRPDENSRLSNVDPVSPITSNAPNFGLGPMPAGKVNERTASMLFPNDKIFTPNTFAAQGGIMNARKQIQRVA